VILTIIAKSGVLDGDIYISVKAGPPAILGIVSGISTPGYGKGYFRAHSVLSAKLRV